MFMQRRPRLLAALAAAALVSAPAFAAGGGHGESSACTTEGASYVPFGAMTATIARDYQPVGLLQIEVGVEAPDPALHARVIRLEPRLRAACGEALRVYLRDMYIVGTPPDADRIAVLMQEAIDEVLGQEGATLLLATLVVHGARHLP